MDSLKASDAEAATHAVAPRVTLEDIEGAIAARFHFNGKDACARAQIWGGNTLSSVLQPEKLAPLEVLSICVLVMKNGFTIIGKSAPASPANFNADFGRKLAYEDCIRQLWPLMGFALRDKLAAA